MFEKFSFDIWNAIITVFSIIAGTVGFLVRRLYKKLDDQDEKIELHDKRYILLETEVSELKIKIAENHPNKDEFRQFKNEIYTMLTQLLNPINSKLENIDNYLRSSVLKRKDD